LTALPVLQAASAHSGAGSTPPGFSWIGFLGPFHMLVLHYPIGFLTLAVLLEVWIWWRPNAFPAQVNRATLALAAVSAVVAAGLGWCRAQGAEYDPGLLGEHLRLGIATAGLSVVTCGFHWGTFYRPDSIGIRAGYRALLFLAFGCLLAAGHHGGSLTHGRSFLSENAPAFLQPLLGPEPTIGSSATTSPPESPSPTGTPTNPFRSPGSYPSLTPGPASATLSAGTATNRDGSIGPADLGRNPGPNPNPNQEATDRYAAVKAVFAAKCYSCHGPEKQKNKYRLDDASVARKGGKSGVVAIVPGDPFQSNLLRLILLPRNHDDAMPPEGKEGLTAAEVWSVIQWIQAGAPWP
jgi:mono/diheme cytochrome c family protein/uncharacterized membrane protein